MPLQKLVKVEVVHVRIELKMIVCTVQWFVERWYRLTRDFEWINQRTRNTMQNMT